MRASRWMALVPILLSFVLWEVVSSSGVVNRTLFPPPSEVLDAFVGLASSGELYVHLNASLWRVLAGLSLGSFVGIALGLLTGRFKALGKSLTPLFQVLRSFPPVAIIPLVIVWFGIGESAKLFSISFAVFFPVWINSHIGASRIPEHYLQIASTFRIPFVKKWFKVILPASLEFIVAGVRTGIAIAFIMVFVSELTGASNGLGYMISIAQLSYRIDVMIAGLFILGIMGAATDFAVVRTVQKLFSWFGRK